VQSEGSAVIIAVPFLVVLKFSLKRHLVEMSEALIISAPNMKEFHNLAQ